MIKLSNSNLLSVVTKLLVLLVIAKGVSLVGWWYLPSDGEEISKKTSYQPKYQRVDFKSMVQKSVPKRQAKESVEESSVESGVSITNMTLKGLYGNAKRGFIIVALKSAPKETTIVGVGEVYSGYRLKSIAIDSAKFTKSSKEYVLELAKAKNSKSFINKVNKPSSQRAQRYQDQFGDEEISEKEVSREDINFYAKNPKQLWKDIAIKEVKKGKKIEGFKVTRIDPKSKMATLGLKKNDLIIKANNKELKSYKDAIDLYKNINKLDTIQIVVLRNNQEKELVYEIH